MAEAIHAYILRRSACALINVTTQGPSGNEASEQRCGTSCVSGCKNTDGAETCMCPTLQVFDSLKTQSGNLTSAGHLFPDIGSSWPSPGCTRAPLVEARAGNGVRTGETERGTSGKCEGNKRKMKGHSREETQMGT